MRRHVNDLTRMVNTINNYNNNHNLGHLLLNRLRASGRGRTYSYSIRTSFVGDINTILNWCGYGECHGFLVAYMKDIDNLEIDEKKVNDRVEEIRRNEFNNLTEKIRELEKALEETRDNAEMTDYERKDHDQLSEFVSRLEKTNEDLNTLLETAKKDISSLKYKQDSYNIKIGELMFELSSKERTNQLLTKENEALKNDSAFIKNIHDKVVAENKKLKDDGRRIPEGFVLTPSVGTVYNNLMTNKTATIQQYLEWLLKGWMNARFFPITHEDSAVFARLIERPEVTDKLRKMLLERYVSSIVAVGAIYGNF